MSWLAADTIGSRYPRGDVIGATPLTVINCLHLLTIADEVTGVPFHFFFLFRIDTKLMSLFRISSSFLFWRGVRFKLFYYCL